jgi:glycosyltransferase involved in cell wall biosynthesis
MKIVYPLNGDILGGEESGFNDFFSLANALNFEQIAVVFEDDINLKKYLQINQIYFTTIRRATPYENKKQIKKLAQNLEANMLIAFSEKACENMPTGEFINIASVNKFLDFNNFKNIDYFMVGSSSIEKSLLNIDIPSERIRVLPAIIGEKTGKALSRRDMFIPEKSPIILASGELLEENGFDVLFKSLSYLSDVYLLVDGDGAYRKNLEEYAQKVGIKPRTRFLGYRMDKKNLAELCNLCVAPSKNDTIGRSILEAFGHKIPLVTVNSPAAQRLVRLDETGMVVRVDDALSLANSIKQILENKNDAKQMVLAAYEFYQSNFSYDDALKKYKNFLQSVYRKNIKKEYFLENVA